MPTPINDGAAAIAAMAHIPQSEIWWRNMKAKKTIPQDAPAQEPAMAING